MTNTTGVPVDAFSQDIPIHQADVANALKLSIEWQETISCLVAQVYEDVQTVVDVVCHDTSIDKYWQGKLSVLRMFKHLADADVDRFRDGRSIVDELMFLRKVADIVKSNPCRCAGCADILERILHEQEEYLSKM